MSKEYHFSAWEGKSFTINCDGAYLSYCRYLGIKSFGQLNAQTGEALFWHFIDDYQHHVIDEDQLCCLCNCLYDECPGIAENKHIGDLVLFLGDLSFQLHHHRPGARENLQAAIVKRQAMLLNLK